MKFIVYPFSNSAPTVRTAPTQRDWMDETPESFAYRCLPLTIANSHGWEVLNPRPFTARWTGEVRKESVEVEFDKDSPAPNDNYVRPMGHFGSGVLTFDMPMMFKTPPGWSIWAQGPVNRPKDGIAALTGVIETDWSPYTFTMNWMFTRANHEVRFEAGEPIAHIFPVRRSTMERIEPEIRSLQEDPDRKQQNDLWRESRGGFLQALSAKDADAVAEKWQKAYYRGVRPDGKQGAKDHQIKLRLKEFARPEKKA